MAYSQFLRSHKIQDPESSPLGVSASDFRAVMNFVGNNMQKQRQLARSIRDRNTLVAYRPSVLRQRPVFITGFPNRPHYMCPLPELLVSRVAEGLFFDLVPKSDDIRRIIGERYESYCLEILGHYFSSSHSIIPQISYNNRVSPDILVLDRVEDGQHYNISAIIECKSKRISMRTRGSPLPAREVEGDIQEIAKGIYQIWKFFSAVRTFSDLDQYSTDEMTFGVVLTLEPWMEMAHTSIDRVFAMADEMADEQGGIEPVDRKPVTFVAIDDLEYCLARYSSDDILRELRRKCEREVQSYHLSSLLREENISLTGSERFSYFERLSEVCEWCHLFDTHMG